MRGHVAAPRRRAGIARHRLKCPAKQGAAALDLFPTENGAGSENRLRTFQVIRATLLS
jgi:hypothetical protein